jgi:hypothetical protein
MACSGCDARGGADRDRTRARPESQGWFVLNARETASARRDRSTGPEWGAYPVDDAAMRHGAGVERETTHPPEAYAQFGKSELTRYRESWL